MIEQGCIVSSLKGHDTGRIYVVVKVEGEFAYVVDGKYRLLNNSKKKRLKHLHDMHEAFEGFQEKLNANKLYDFEIQKRILGILHKNWNNYFKKRRFYAKIRLFGNRRGCNRSFT